MISAPGYCAAVDGLSCSIQEQHAHPSSGTCFLCLQKTDPSVSTASNGELERYTVVCAFSIMALSSNKSPDQLV